MYADYQILSTFTIGVVNVDIQQTCYTFSDTIPEGGNQTFTCTPQPLVGRYVSVKKFAGGLFNRPDTIVLCEVIVRGSKYLRKWTWYMGLAN